MLQEIIFQYHDLVNKIEQRWAELAAYYDEHIICRPGCSQCCHVERSVLSLEAFFIEQQLKEFSQTRIRKMKKLSKKNPSVCPMLWGDLCAIYPVRPIICRTHGLPILYFEAEIAFVDYCRLNFTELPETYEFEDDLIIDMREYNSELVRLDQLYVSDVLHSKWDPDARKSLFSILHGI